MTEKSKTAKVRSPRAPSMMLQDAYEATSKLYDEWRRAEIAREDVATVLGHESATSGTFKQKLYTLREYGFLTENEQGNRFTVATEFLDLRDHSRGDGTFRETALKLLKNAKAYAQVLNEHAERVPNADLLGRRLERQGYTPERGREVAEQLISALRWAGIIDQENRFISGDESAGEEEGEREPAAKSGGGGEKVGDGDSRHSDRTPDPAPPGALRLEMPTAGGSKVVVMYPPDLSARDAQRVGIVLQAIAGDPT